MSGGIFLIQNDGQLVEMTEQKYDSEDLLQSLLAQYPNLLAGDQINKTEPRRWLLVSREVGIPDEKDGYDRWSIDHLFLDQDGIPTLIEVKRSTDTRIRREVVGQLLDYAANSVVFWSIDIIRAKFEANCQLNQKSPQEELTNLLGAETDDIAIDNFWQKVKTNLEAGRIRLVFVADLIPPELQRIVEFLNVQMNPAEVLAVEIRQFVGQNVKTLIPRVIGQTTEAQQRKLPRKPTGIQWDETLFFEELGKKDKNYLAVASKLLKWSEERKLAINWSVNTQTGVFYPTITKNKKPYTLFRIYATGFAEIVLSNPPYKSGSILGEQRKNLFDRLKSIEISLRPDQVDKAPTIRFSTLLKEGAVDRFLEIFDWIVKEVNSNT